MVGVHSVFNSLPLLSPFTIATLILNKVCTVANLITDKLYIFLNFILKQCCIGYSRQCSPQFYWLSPYLVQLLCCNWLIFTGLVVRTATLLYLTVIACHVLCIGIFFHALWLFLNWIVQCGVCLPSRTNPPFFLAAFIRCNSLYQSVFIFWIVNTV
jgi:hypothetical protein